MRKAVIALLFAVSVLACDSHSDDETYVDFQECFDDHTTGEGLPVEQAIVVCALDHPQLGVPAFQTEAECEAYIDAELSAESATLEEIAAACVTYFQV